MPMGQGEGESTSSEVAGVASLPGGLSLNALKAGPSDRLRGGPPTRASGPSFIETPLLTRERGPYSHVGLGCSGSTGVGGGAGLGRALQEGARRTEERREDGQCGRPRNFWALQWWYLQARGDAGPKGEVQGEQDNCV